jgi:folate-binding protein YgfZ
MHKTELASQDQAELGSTGSIPDGGTGFYQHRSRSILRLTGADRLDFLHRISSNDLLSLKPFESSGTLLLTDKGRLVDWVRVLQFPTETLLLTGIDSGERVRGWIDKYTIMEELQTTDVTPGSLWLSIVGESSVHTLQHSFQIEPKPGSITQGGIGNCAALINQWVWRTTTVTDIIVPAVDGTTGEMIYTELRNAGIPSMTSAAFDRFRILNGCPESGHEITSDYNPYECGLRSQISFTKGCYIGQEVVARLDTYRKIQRKLVLIRFTEPFEVESLPVPIDLDGHSVGTLTSLSGVSQGADQISLGIVRNEAVSVGAYVHVGTMKREVRGYIQKEFVE